MVVGCDDLETFFAVKKDRNLFRLLSSPFDCDDDVILFMAFLSFSGFGVEN